MKKELIIINNSIVLGGEQIETLPYKGKYNL